MTFARSLNALLCRQDISSPLTCFGTICCLSQGRAGLLHSAPHGWLPPPQPRRPPQPALSSEPSFSRPVLPDDRLRHRRPAIPLAGGGGAGRSARGARRGRLAAAGGCAARGGSPSPPQCPCGARVGGRWWPLVTVGGRCAPSAVRGPRGPGRAGAGWGRCWGKAPGAGGVGELPPG